MNRDNLTERQKKWFASVQASLERETGKTLAEWVKLAKKCPETKPKARADWLRENYGLGVNRAAQILHEAFPPEPGSEEPAAQRAALWKDAASLALLEKLEAAIAKLSDVVPTQRKGFTAWSRKVQFAAAKPVKGGHLALGLAIAVAGKRLVAAKNEGWSERLTAKLVITKPSEIDRDVIAWIKQAADRS
ncbi:DUF4287 domain-containing protein [Roseiterribacter gracilis]|uniref:DUF5655 domain-containing protein n=1 Tax=Roseiterribacter gracilis TaxID=2812848 RepID=A0A8S8X999_9PROT|nr:hypothetical protein TMPK1_01040 [Rhodospirillales bacterium TMPK1]